MNVPMKMVVMIGPSLSSKGGVASVCAEYRRSGLFSRLGIVFLPSYESGGSLHKLGIALTSAARLVGLLARKRVALVHVHMATGASIWRKLVYCVIAATAGVPYVVHLHSGKLPEYFDERCGPVRRWLFSRLLKFSAAVLVLTNERKTWLLQRDLRAPAIEVLPNFVLLSAELRVDLERSAVVFMGRLEEEKGVSTLLDAFTLVRTLCPNVRLRLAGEGELARYREQAIRLGIIDAVSFLGWVDGQAKSDLISSAKVLVLPSQYEGLPMAVLEAMSFGVPCVATSVGGMPDIITDGVNGRLIPVSDAPALADAISALLSDESYNARLGRSARETIERRFSVSTIETTLSDIYRRTRKP